MRQWQLKCIIIVHRLIVSLQAWYCNSESWRLFRLHKKQAPSVLYLYIHEAKHRIMTNDSVKYAE